MIKSELKKRLDNYFQTGVEQGLWSSAAGRSYVVEEPKNQDHGDFSTNMAMVIAGTEKKQGNPGSTSTNPREIAAGIVSYLMDQKDLIKTCTVAGPGFVNVKIHEHVWQQVLPRIVSAGDDFCRSNIGGGKKVLVEFVSANPTGPLSVGHGRQAVLGDAIARLLEATGHMVTREYYYNDAGRQMRVLGESTRARYLELIGAEGDFPEDGYQGQYIWDIASELKDEVGESLKNNKDVTPFKEKAEQVIFKDINGTLTTLGIHFDNYYNEHTLYEKGMVDDVVKVLRDKGLVYDHEGAVWFKTSEFGQEKDRVIIKSTGEPTYRLPDIAYHREKFRRGFDWMVNIFGSDHIATVPDVLAGVEALGYDSSKVTVVLHQFVTLMRGGKQVKMSTRKATFITVDELIDEVGVDVVRFFFLMRKADSQLEFDLDLAKTQSQENPVFYVQYAHARLCSIAKQAESQGVEKGNLDDVVLDRLSLPEEFDMLKAMAGFPAFIENAAIALEPHRIVFYLQDLAAKFHSYYNKHRVIADDADIARARLWLAAALAIVFKNGLELIGVKAPESM